MVAIVQWLVSSSVKRVIWVQFPIVTPNDAPVISMAEEHSYKMLTVVRFHPGVPKGFKMKRVLCFFGKHKFKVIPRCTGCTGHVIIECERCKIVRISKFKI